MSGPKTSKYALTPEQRRILEEQRKLELRRTKAKQSIKRNKKILLGMEERLSSQRKIARELLSRKADDGGFTEKIRELDELTAPVASILAGIDQGNVDSLEKSAAELDDRAQRAGKLAGELEKLARHNEAVLQNKLNEAVDRGFAASFADIRSAAGNKLGKEREKIRLALMDMEEASTLPEAWRLEVKRALRALEDIQQEAFVKNFAAVTVDPLLKNCRQAMADYERCHAAFDELNGEYTALCELYGCQAKEYSCTEDSLQALRDEVEKLRAAIAEDEEQAYIGRCLDEVMEEMGYAVLGSREVTKKNGRHFRNELYSYGEGTAVNVTYSSDGKIAMEIGGVDTADRLPEDWETELLCGRMEKFCSDFPQIEKRLRDKGVVLAERISLLPPEAEYAQIINTADYEMIAGAERLKKKDRRRSETRGQLTRDGD